MPQPMFDFDFCLCQYVKHTGQKIFRIVTRVRHTYLSPAPSSCEKNVFEFFQLVVMC